MALQPVFKRGYIDYLKNNIKPEAYLGDHFEYDQSQVVRLYGVPHPVGLLERLDPIPDGDLQSAIAIYEAYPDLSPLFAQQDDLWVYLTHVDLFEYVKKRWPIKIDNDLSVASQCDYISDHWFRGHHSIIRSTLMGLWWSVFCTIDESRSDKYELTKVLFCNYSFRTRYFGTSELIRHREAMIGILSFLHENPILFKSNIEVRGQFISRYFNQLGGVKLLVSLDRNFFRNECERIKQKLLDITERNQVQNIDVFDSF